MLLHYYNYFNLNILLMALHEHPTFYYWPTSTSIRLALSFPSYIIAICMRSCLVHGIVIIQQFHLNKGYTSSYYCSTAGGARAVHVSTAKFIQILLQFNTLLFTLIGNLQCTLL